MNGNTRREIIQLAAWSLMGNGIPTAARAAPLSQREAIAGLRELLQRGAQNAVAQLGQPNGFLAHAQVRIPLPPKLERAAPLLRAAGQGKRLDELETTMNRAAELAVQQAQPLLLGAIQAMSVADARKVLTGAETSVTDFFADKTRQPLTERFLPVVRVSTERLSLVRKYNDAAQLATQFGLLGSGPTDVAQYVTGKAIDGLYFVIGEEERRIRQDPIGTGSKLLKKIFGSL